MQLFKSTVARKIIMAVTGILMVLFVVLHLLGNTSVFAGPDGINAYAATLKSLGPFIWIYRVFMLIIVSLHVFFGIQLTLENHEAKPLSNIVKTNLVSTFASRNMIWSGAVIAAYLVYHLLHFTITVINPETSAFKTPDALGRPDVFRMVVLNFQNLIVSSVYILSMSALFLHTVHGIPSLFQTLGLNNEKMSPFISGAGKLAAIIIFLGFISIPVVILAGILRLR